VASYFCLSDGTVVHAVAGPVDAKRFLQEARWAVDLRKLAVTESGGSVAKYRATVRKGHLERLAAGTGLRLPANTLPQLTGGNPPVPHAELLRLPGARGLDQHGQVSLLLAYYPLAKLDQLYPIVFERVLKEKVSTLPVDVVITK